MSLAPNDADIRDMRAFRISLFLLFVGASLWLLLRRSYLLHGEQGITDAQRSLLMTEGRKAIITGDVPVAAILLHKGEVIGSGYNTQRAHWDAAGHAEVNAVSDAMQQLGWEAFNKLDRDSLVLVSTFEPCSMCRGMMAEHRIRHMAFLKPKGLWTRLRSDLVRLRLEWNRWEVDDEGLQDSLFRAHPAYDPATADH